MPVIDANVRQVYNSVKRELMSQNYGIKAAMLEAKKLIIQYEKDQRANRLQNVTNWRELISNVGTSISDGIAISDLENQLNALIVEDIALM